MTEQELRDYAERLMIEHAFDVEFLTIHEMAEEHFGHEISEKDAQRVDTLMSKAIVTVVLGD